MSIKNRKRIGNSKMLEQSLKLKLKSELLRCSFFQDFSNFLTNSVVRSRVCKRGEWVRVGSRSQWSSKGSQHVDSGSGSGSFFQIEVSTMKTFLLGLFVRLCGRAANPRVNLSVFKHVTVGLNETYAAVNDASSPVFSCTM